MVFSERAVQALHHHLRDSVEVLPVQYPGNKKYYIIHFTKNLDCLDNEKSSVQRYEWGKVASIDKYVFTNKVNGAHFFTLPETRGNEVIVSKEFVDEVQYKKLTGARFPPLP